MLEKITLLDRAKADLMVVKMILDNPESCEVMIDIAGYHTQQTVEKCLKFMLNQAGRPHPRTHDIYALAQQIEKYNFTIPEWVMENADVLNEFDTRTRYGTRLVASRAKIEALFLLTDGLINDLDPEPTKTGGEFAPSNYF